MNINPTLNNKSITPNRSQLTDPKNDVVLDKEWARKAFLVSDSELDDPEDRANRYATTTDWKFTDTRLGGNLAINARPQYCWYSDIRRKGRLPGRNDVTVQNVGGNYGMGRIYSETMDDPSQLIYLRFGVHSFNSITSFLAAAFDPDLTGFNRTGRGTSIFYKAGDIIGTVLRVRAFPVLSLGLSALNLINTFFGRRSSRFYSLKPTMFIYWSTVQTLVQTIAINLGILPRVLADEVTDQKINTNYQIDQTILSELHRMIPDIINDKNGIDIYALANRAQRMANQAQQEAYDTLNNGSATNYVNYVEKGYQTALRHPQGEHTLANYLNRVLSFGYYVSEGQTPQLEPNPKIDPTTGKLVEGYNSPIAQSAGNFFDAEFRDGSQWAVFRVDHTGTVQEAFNNTAVESEASQKLNSMSSQAGELRFSLGDGNIGDNFLTNGIEAIAGGVKDLAVGAANAVTFDVFKGIQGLMGSGYIDIPKHWQSSSVTLPKSTYTMQLVSPYGNVISQLQNIYIPLCMILAAGLPRSTGSQSYTGPFLVEMFDRGRCRVRLGIIESITISRGTTHLPFTIKGRPLGIDVSFTVLDLSTIMHMPVSTGGLFGTDKTLDEDNILMDYLSVLAGQDVYSQLYSIPKAKLRLAKYIASAERLTSPAYWAALTNEETTSGLLSYTTFGFGAKALKNLVSGNLVIKAQ